MLRWTTRESALLLPLLLFVAPITATTLMDGRLFTADCFCLLCDAPTLASTLRDDLPFIADCIAVA